MSYSDLIKLALPLPHTQTFDICNTIGPVEKDYLGLQSNPGSHRSVEAESADAS